MDCTQHETIQLSSEAIALLRSEAESLQFVHAQSENFGIKPAEARITSPFNMATARGTNYCVELANDTLLVETAQRLLERPVVFSACNYILYDSGSFLGLHTDRPGCEINALILLAGESSVVELRPLKPEESVHDLLRLSRLGRGLVDDTDVVPLPEPGAAVVFHATEIPHQRRPPSGPLLLLSICYGPETASSR